MGVRGFCGPALGRSSVLPTPGVPALRTTTPVSQGLPRRRERCSRSGLGIRSRVGCSREPTQPPQVSVDTGNVATSAGASLYRSTLAPETLTSRRYRPRPVTSNEVTRLHIESYTSIRAVASGSGDIDRRGLALSCVLSPDSLTAIELATPLNSCRDEKMMIRSAEEWFVT